MNYNEHMDLAISEIGIGCYGLGGAYGEVDTDAYRRTLQRAYDLGVNFFDTADAYGEAEKILGEVIHPFRQDILLATKVGVREGFKPNLSREYVIRACEDSLERLDTETIDLYQVHFDDPGTPVEETLEALEALKSQGKIRHFGVGHISTERMRAYFEHGGCFSAMMELSAVARDHLKTTLPACREYDVAGITFSVTGRGLLTGKIWTRDAFSSGDIRSIDPLFQRHRFVSGLRIADRLARIGKDHSKTGAQVAIAWVLAQPGVTCALTGPSRIAHLEENLGASGWRLPEERLAELDAAFAEEEAWLRSQDLGSIRSLLAGPLPEDFDQAFKDLLFVIESAVQHGLVSEALIMPSLQALFALRGPADAGKAGKMAEIQAGLRELIPLQTGEPS